MEKISVSITVKISASNTVTEKWDIQLNIALHDRYCDRLTVLHDRYCDRLTVLHDRYWDRLTVLHDRYWDTQCYMIDTVIHPQ